MERTAEALHTNFVQHLEVWYVAESAGEVDCEEANGATSVDTRQPLEGSSFSGDHDLKH